MNDRIQELDVFLRVADASSFSAAARGLDCSPSTVSKRIQRLEDRLRVRLFHRTSRVLRLTREGEKFLAGAHRVIEAIDEAETGLGQSGFEASGVLRINCALLLAQHQLSPLIPEFLERHPAMRLEFVLSAAPLEPVENQIDVSFQSGSIPDSSRVARRIATTRWGMCAAPAYLARHGTPRTVEDLRHHNCLNFLPGSFPNHWPLRDGAELAAHEIKGNIGSNSSELLRSFAVAGVGIARLSDMHVDSDIRAGRLVRVLEAFRADTEAPLYVVYASRRNLSLRVKAFLDFIVEKFGAPPAAGQAISSTTLPVT
ncbi:LysR family transcriptional regulator [Variovorax sp. 770b2]|uniref:LysR family transcriptional regulator n=1 Tax=Variovorax sp. 770b2 TaxID=1566271 RepID=UPI0015A6905E|nr:LysR family transcriptional regulator [Variovorax sp. 770b2]